MPLKKSSSNKARQINIQEMIASGHDPKQAVAASYSNQREMKKRKLSEYCDELISLYETKRKRRILDKMSTGRLGGIRGRAIHDVVMASRSGN